MKDKHILISFRYKIHSRHGNKRHKHLTYFIKGTIHQIYYILIHMYIQIMIWGDFILYNLTLKYKL